MNEEFKKGGNVRYVVEKKSGSHLAYVLDTETARTIKRYNIFKQYSGVDGWAAAKRHVEFLNGRST